MRIAFITGGHTFEVLALHKMLRELDGIDAYVQHMEDFAGDVGRDRGSYDAAVHYHMLTSIPQDSDPWPRGHIRKAIEAIPTMRQGVVILHHGLVAWPEWQVWSELVGIRDRTGNKVGFADVQIEVASSQHPITQGLKPWTMHDETYLISEPDSKCEILLTTKTSGSMRTLAWAHTIGEARVVCIQSGHGPSSWNAPQFRRLLTQAIAWSARKA